MNSLTFTLATFGLGLRSFCAGHLNRLRIHSRSGSGGCFFRLGNRGGSRRLSFGRSRGRLGSRSLKLLLLNEGLLLLDESHHCGGIHLSRVDGTCAHEAQLRLLCLGGRLHLDGGRHFSLDLGINGSNRLLGGLLSNELFFLLLGGEHLRVGVDLLGGLLNLGEGVLVEQGEQLFLVLIGEVDSLESGVLGHGLAELGEVGSDLVVLLSLWLRRVHYVSNYLGLGGRPRDLLRGLSSICRHISTSDFSDIVAVHSDV